jgi:pectin methylesterase-like acyl-CoA thioesterase
MCALPVQGFAAGSGTAQVVVVAKSGGDKTNPIDAVNSITDASATKPYLIKVMPGVYDLGTASLVMKPFVYLEGSGDSSIVTSAIVNTDRQCFLGTVKMANNSTVKNIRIQNSGGVGADNLTYVGVVFSDVKATLESVSVYSGSDNLPAGEAVAVCSRGASADATLNNVILEARSGTGTSDTVLVADNSTMLIKNSKVVAYSASSNHVIDCHNLESMPTEDYLSMANLTLINSYVEGRAPNNNEIFWGNGCKTATIVNSTIVGNASGSVGVYSNRNTSIINTRIIAETAVSFDESLGNTIKIANSNIEGTIQNLTNVKLLNNFDANFNPIANQ